MLSKEEVMVEGKKVNFKLNELSQAFNHTKDPVGNTMYIFAQNKTYKLKGKRKSGLSLPDTKTQHLGFALYKRDKDEKEEELFLTLHKKI